MPKIFQVGPTLFFHRERRLYSSTAVFGISTVAQRANPRSLAKNIGSQNSRQTAIVIGQTFGSLKVWVGRRLLYGSAS